MSNAPRNAVEFDRVSIVFGDHPDRALPLMDAGQSRAEIQQATGQVLHQCCHVGPTGRLPDAVFLLTHGGVGGALRGMVQQ